MSTSTSETLPIVATSTHPQLTCSAAMNSENEDIKTLRQRAEQKSILVNELPLNIHCGIFKLLEPASQRILGATCVSFYETFNEHCDGKVIQAHLSEFATVNQGFTGTPAYQIFIHKWLFKDRCPVALKSAIIGLGTSSLGSQLD
ncbi:uncharacterized protein LY89DRAFT_739860 [Mollisia scopiformis]|uniref:Uncharacterized protein n=1 Tax=Mollisia scopiformis TaxID=149040 RepID=A0A194WT80_MOLSC|nr:uncharacterized protein LY89DRAFT_739860 [Mollisia scopiformis]KUJ10879.1 hypothetical protein LY89DRAFT_739860 [Mollisia scopiformis]